MARAVAAQEEFIALLGDFKEGGLRDFGADLPAQTLETVTRQCRLVDDGVGQGVAAEGFGLVDRADEVDQQAHVAGGVPDVGPQVPARRQHQHVAARQRLGVFGDGEAFGLDLDRVIRRKRAGEPLIGTRPVVNQQDAGILALGGDGEARLLAFDRALQRQLAASRDAALRDQQQVEHELDLVLRQQRALWQLPRY